MKKLWFFESESPDCYSQLAQMRQAQQAAKNLANAFILAKPALIGHLLKQYGHQLEINEIQSEMWLAVLRAGQRKGVNLVNYVCNAVQRQARNGQALLNYTTDHARNNDGEQINIEETHTGEVSLLHCDPVDILIARETAIEVGKRCGSIWMADLEGIDNTDGITERGMRKRRERNREMMEQVSNSAQQDMFWSRS